MAGCYGNSPEDRHFEEQMHAHLDKPDFDEQVRDRVAELLIDAIAEHVASDLCVNWELLATADVEIIKRAAECAAELARRPFDREGPLAALGADILRIITDRLETVARHQLEREE